MSSLILMLMLQSATTQFLVSTKAGLVNYVQGSASVKPASIVPAGKTVATGPQGAVELLLNPGSYLRMGESTRIVFEKVDLYDIRVRLLEGSMVITANGFDKDLPLHVASGDLGMEIIKDGIYLFADGKVVVVDGRIRDAANGLVYGKGYQISNDRGYRAQKVKTFTTALELWSQKRDEEIAQANVRVARSLRQTGNAPIGSLLNVWLWYPAYGGFIYMPGRGYRSPYGYRYMAAGEVYIPAVNTGSSGGFGGGGSASNAGNSGGSNNTSSAGSGGGGPAPYSITPASTGASSPTPSPRAESAAPAPSGAHLGK